MTAPPKSQSSSRHGIGKDGKPCKYADDEQYKRCNCRKHLRWFANGKQADTKHSQDSRSWAQAEQAKRELEDQLGGKADTDALAQSRRHEQSVPLSEAIDLCMMKQEYRGRLSDGVLKAYKRLTERLNAYC